MAVSQRLVLRQQHSGGAKCEALHLLQSSLCSPMEWALFTEGGWVVATTRPLKKMQARDLTGGPSYVKLEVRKPTNTGA